MNRFAKLLALSAVAAVAFGCEQRTDKTHAGGVIITVSHFDGWPISVSASADYPVVQVEEITVDNHAVNPNEPTSPLMDVEVHSYEITYNREDTGTRIPPKLVNHVFGTLPVNGTYTLNDGPIMRFDQFEQVPISDLRDYGRDLETNTQVIRLRLTIQFFGKTLSGDPVASAPAYFTLEVTP